MSQDFQDGDFLIFQIESGYGLLRLLAVDTAVDGRVWHLRGYAEMFPDIDSAEAALEHPDTLTVSMPHAAITNRAFEATQTARLKKVELSPEESAVVGEWRKRGAAASDRSIRLILGLR